MSMNNFRKDQAVQTVADYDIVFDTLQNLGAGAGQDPDRDFSLSINKNVSVETRAVLSWMLDPAASGVTFDISVNGKAVVTGLTIPASESHAIQEVMDGGILVVPPGANKLTIKVTKGSAKLSDMVLLYQVNGLDPTP